MRIIFFSEGLEHTRFLMPIINKLSTINNLKIDYYSLDKNEEIKISKKLNFILIERKKILKIFKNISADFFFTTTPGIGSFYFPKSAALSEALGVVFLAPFESLASFFTSFFFSGATN